MSLLVCAGLVALAPQISRGEEDELPLKPDHTLEFAVDEATWLSLDVAPVGDTLVLEVLGNLYTLNIEGGQAKPLLVGTAFDSQPRYSPDGSRLAFISDRDGSDELWIMDLASEELTKLSDTNDRTDMASPVWSPEGEHVLVSRGNFELGTYELWLYPIKGGKRGIQITKARSKPSTRGSDRHNALGAVYDPTGRYVYYARKRGGFEYNLKFPSWQIARRDLQTGHEDILTQATGSAFRPALSPDGNLLIYGTRYEQQTGLRIRNLASGKDEWLAYPVQRDEQESRFTRDLLPGYAFSPDGDALYLTIAGRIKRIALTSRAVTDVPFSIDVEQPVKRRLAFSNRAGLGPVKARILANAELSPDGTKLAFAAFARIYVHDLEKDVTRAVSPVSLPSAFPVWSNDGKALAYVSWTGEGGHIYRQPPRPTGRPKQLTQDAAQYLYPAWSPDDKRIVALRSSASEQTSREWGNGPAVGADIIWLPARGGSTNLVTPSRGLTRPHFGPELDRIYLQASSGTPALGSTGLVSMRFDGTDRRELLKVSGPGIYNQDTSGAQMIKIAPDGRHVLFQHSNQIYLTRLAPYLTRQSIKLGSSNLPLAKLTDVGADFAGFDRDASTLYWVVGDQLYRRSLASIEFEQKDKPADAGENEADGEDAEAPLAEQVVATGAVEAVAETDPDTTRDDVEDDLLEAHEAVIVNEIAVYMPRHRPAGTVALTGATVLSMDDAGIIDNAVVVVDGDRITQVGRAAEVSIPPGTEIIELRGKTIVPGYVDTHAHYRITQDVPDRFDWPFLANLAYGVTTGMDVQSGTHDLFIAQDMVDAGLKIGPRAFTTGPGVFNNNEFKSRAHAGAVLKRYKDRYRVNNIKAYISGSRKQRQWIIEAAEALRLMPTTEGFLDMKLNLTHMIDGFSGLEHSLPVPHLYDDVIQLTARSEIAYTPTLLVVYGGPQTENLFYAAESPHDDPKLRRFTPYSFLASRTLRRAWFHPREYVTADVADSARRIVEAGGQVGVGAHGQLQGLGYHWELWSLAMGSETDNESNLALLRSATLMGAQMLGLSEDLGSIKAGKLADLVVLNSNPLDDIRATSDIALVMKGGELFDADTLDQIWPEKKPLPEQWWWKITPNTQLKQQVGQ